MYFNSSWIAVSDSANKQIEDPATIWKRVRRQYPPSCTRWGCGKRGIVDKGKALHKVVRSIIHLRHASDKPMAMKRRGNSNRS